MVDHRYISLLVVVAVVVIVAVIGMLMGTSGITGATVGVGGVACYSNSDCNDGITATEDTCKNPGTIGSLCINKPA